MKGFFYFSRRNPTPERYVVTLILRNKNIICLKVTVPALETPNDWRRNFYLKVGEGTFNEIIIYLWIIIFPYWKNINLKKCNYLIAAPAFTSCPHMVEVNVNEHKNEADLYRSGAHKQFKAVSHRGELLEVGFSGINEWIKIRF